MSGWMIFDGFVSLTQVSCFFCTDFTFNRFLGLPPVTSNRLTKFWFDGQEQVIEIPASVTSLTSQVIPGMSCLKMVTISSQFSGLWFFSISM